MTAVTWKQKAAIWSTMILAKAAGIAWIIYLWEWLS